MNLGMTGVNVLGALGEISFIQLVFASLFALLYIWLLVGAIGMLQRSQSGFVNIRRWSICTTILYATCFSLSFAAVFMAHDKLERNLPPDLSGLADILVALLVGAAVWHLFWPVFCFVWTGRATIQEQVKQW